MRKTYKIFLHIRVYTKVILHQKNNMPTTAKNQKTATFNVDIELWESFKSKASDENTTATRLLNSWIKAYLKGENPLAAQSEIEEIKARLRSLEFRSDRYERNYKL